ncbi:carboxypeptidase-like regulatory domain-containing protein [uncultured Bacteroides sp.]|uniref:carboxypeptidase-like regulatory domain-containing protein n=1 Tax=uncultured Bacteroides sp. TaxID=162156 RepID=UPI002AA6917E|nr:carboxypeptidase-like regulatory domain-containing protein [uncultured Bacteroides sp.]
MNRLRKHLCVFVMLFSLVLSGYAQGTKKISGTVTDEKGEVIIGANITLAGNKSIGTITDIEGHFLLSVPVKGSLEVTYIGYNKKLVALDHKTIYSITLLDQSRHLL